MPYKKNAHPANKKLHNSALYHRTPDFRELPRAVAAKYSSYARDRALFFLWKVHYATITKLAAESGLSTEGVRKSLLRYTKHIYKANIADARKEDQRERKADAVAGLGKSDLGADHGYDLRSAVS